METTATQITVSAGSPFWLRMIMVTGALVLLVVLYRELGRGLWPLNLAMPFFAIIIGGSTAVLIRLLLFALAGASEAWHFGPERIEIVRGLFGKQRAALLSTSGLQARIVCDDLGDGADRWHVEFDAPLPESLAFGGGMARITALLPWRFGGEPVTSTLRSPGFSSEDAARRALSLAGVATG